MKLIIAFAIICTLVIASPEEKCNQLRKDLQTAVNSFLTAPTKQEQDKYLATVEQITRRLEKECIPPREPLLEATPGQCNQFRKDLQAAIDSFLKAPTKQEQDKYLAIIEQLTRKLETECLPPRQFELENDICETLKKQYYQALKDLESARTPQEQAQIMIKIQEILRELIKHKCYA